MPEQTKQKRVDQLQAFCAKDGHSRYMFNKPFFSGDHVYATDATAMVRMPRGLAPEDLDVGEGHLCKPETVFNDAMLEAADYSGTLETTMEYGVECAACEGEGKVDDVYAWRRCANCGGDGFTECRYCGHGVDKCDKCNGSGKLYKKTACVVCSGKGKLPVFVLGGSVLKPEYVNLIRETFGDVEWGFGAGEDGAVVVFKADEGVCGCLVRMREVGHG